MKRFTLTAFLIVIMVSGFILVSLDNFGFAAPGENPKPSHGPKEPTPASTPVASSVASDKPGNGNGNGNIGNGNGGSGNGNGGINNNGNNGNSGNGNGNTGSGNNGNGNGNNVNNGNGNNGNANGSGNGNGNSNGNNGNENNGNNGNGNENNNGNGNNVNSGNNRNDNGNNGNNGNGSGNNGNGNGNGSATNPNSRYKVSGYILNSNGKGIPSAEIIFCVPDIVPAQFSDNSGYYEMNTPAGKYQVDVWPPFDSNYIFFEQKYLTVNSDIEKNITLPTGYKMSGTIMDTSGAPVSGAVVWLDNPTHTSYYFCGWYSKFNGRYFVTAPAGTYTLNLKPKTGLSFPTYTENNFIVNGDTTKNIILGSLSTTQTSTRSSSLTLTVQAKSFEVGSTLTVNGKLSDQNGNPLTDKTVILSYSVGESGI